MVSRPWLFAATAILFAGDAAIVKGWSAYPNRRKMPPMKGNLAPTQKKCPPLFCLPEDNNHLLELRRKFVTTTAATMLACGVLLSAQLPPAMAATAAQQPALSFDQIQQNLKPATKDQPQIALPMDALPARPPSQQAPIVEGLLFLVNPKSEIRPIATDTIVITVRTAAGLTSLPSSTNSNILAGARIPMSKAGRFPLTIRLFPQNVLPDRQGEWNSVAQDEDLLLEALVCSEDNPKCTSSADQSCRMQAQGIAKLVRNLPGQGTTSIRAAVSLPLK